jgi:FkbH-like protein
MTKPQIVKCVVWDLDGTLWDGVLAEGDKVSLRQEASGMVRELDARGVLQSIASRNDDVALEVLAQLKLRDYFLHPHFGEMPKSVAVSRIAAALDVSIDAMAFVDDDPFERAEVQAAHPRIVCVDAAHAGSMLTSQDIVIPAGTGLNRRRLHLAEMARRQAEVQAGGTSEKFLAQLDMRVVLRRAGIADLPRIDELLLRTNQLNTTGRYIRPEEMQALCSDGKHLALVADLTDRFGDYGTIGFALVSLEQAWVLRMLMVSCRVQDRGVGSAILGTLVRTASGRGQRFQAEYLRTERNRRMYVMLKLGGFVECGRSGAVEVLQVDPTVLAPLPAWINVRDEAGVGSA